MGFARRTTVTPTVISSTRQRLPLKTETCKSPSLIVAGPFSLLLSSSGMSMGVAGRASKELMCPLKDKLQVMSGEEI